MRINITDAEPLDFSIGQGPGGKIVATVPRRKAVVQIAQEKWEQLKDAVSKAREPKPEEKKPEEQSVQQEEATPQVGTETPSSEQPAESSSPELKGNSQEEVPIETVNK